MADFADSTATTLDVELLTPAAAGRLSPALPAGEQVLESNLYAVCELVAGRAARTSSARQYRAIYTRFCDTLRDELGRPPIVADVTADANVAERLEDDIIDLRKALADYRDDIRRIDPSDHGLLEVTDALRLALEAVFRQPLTFAGERREVPQSVVRGEGEAEEVHGYIAGVRARHVIGGQLVGTVKTEKVHPGGVAIGVDIVETPARERDA